MSVVPLSDLRPGRSGTIEALAGDPPFQKRLADLGLVPGTPVVFIRKAPFGDPIEIEVRGYRLALRGKDAGKILVKQ